MVQVQTKDGRISEQVTVLIPKPLKSFAKTNGISMSGVLTEALQNLSKEKAQDPGETNYAIAGRA